MDDDLGQSSTFKMEEHTFTEIFEQCFPYYLSIGMSANEYWHGDISLVEGYRKAEQLRMERKNTESWIQGAYIYEAFIRVAPILNAFAKKGTKPLEYIKEPYPITEEQRKAQEERRAQEEFIKNKMYMETLRIESQERFKRTEGVDGSND